MASDANGKELLGRTGAETATAQVSVMPRASQIALSSPGVEEGMWLVVSMAGEVGGVWSKEIKESSHSGAKVIDRGA